MGEAFKLDRLKISLIHIFVSISVDKVTTDEELEDMLHSDNLSIFISDVRAIPFSSWPQKRLFNSWKYPL